jgi:methionyl-tRNA formyltransferase
LAGGRVWPQRRPADGEIVPGLSETALRNLVRALGPPWPPAWIAVDGHRRDIVRVADRPGAGRIPYETAERTILHLEAPAAP